MRLPEGAVARANFGTDEQHCSAEQYLPFQGFRKTLGGVLDRFPALPSVPLRLVYSSGSGGYHIELAQLNAILTKHNRDHEGRSI